MTQEELWRELGCPPRPTQIWQEPLDYDPSHHERLCDLSQAMGTPPGRDGANDLDQYIEDLTYVHETQIDLALYLLPLCLRAWSMNLLGETAWFIYYGEMFWLLWDRINLYSSERTEGLFDLLPNPQKQAFRRYVSDGILDAIDRSPGLQSAIPQAHCYRWIREIGSFATICPGLSVLWNEWWTLGTEGRAIAALQYISCLMYENSANLIFAAWTPTRGGGPPQLWDDSMFINNQAWHPENIRFLKNVLSPDAIASAIDGSHLRLTNSKDLAIAAQMKTDFSGQRTLVELRIEQLLAILSTSDHGFAEWTV